LWNLKEDFYVFADKRGGIWTDISEKVKKRQADWEAKNPPKNTTEEDDG